MKNKTDEQLENFFWKNYPHEISWGELKEVNLELYNECCEAGLRLHKLGVLGVGYLPNLCCVCDVFFIDGRICEKCTGEGWWFDPAGGLHDPNEDDPGKMYE